MSKDALTWFFPSTDGGDDQGINDALRETFEGDHERYVARESIQNSLDARSSSSEPVRVRFERIEAQTAALPGIYELEDVIRRAEEYAGDEERVGSYAEARTALAQPTISVLKISDFNTKGLSGGDQKSVGGGWYKLVRAAGVNSMSGDGGGSFGIGKGAPFAASVLRTVFYSTVNEQGEHIFQGKARLSSFQNDEPDVRQGVGQYGLLTEGIKGVSSVRDTSLIPSMFAREQQGTDVYIIGYRTMEQNWKSLLINSILYNFWAAIYFGDLVVELADSDGEQVINQESLDELMAEYSADKDGSYQYYRAVTEPTRVFEAKLELLGNVKLYVLTESNMPRKIQMMRKSKMLVYPKPCRVIPDSFAGVFICEDVEGNKLLRELEPPKHDEWEAKRDPVKGKKILKELDGWIKQSIKELAGESSTEPEDIQDLGDYLPEVDERDDTKPYYGGDGEPMYTGTDEESAREMGREKELDSLNTPDNRQKPISITINVGRGDATPKPGQENRKNKTHNDGTDRSKEGNLPLLDTSMFVFKAREVIRDGQRAYMAVISPTETETGALRIVAVGDDNAYPVELDSVRDESGRTFQVSGSSIKGLELKQNEKLKLYLKLKQNRRYRLGVESNER